MKTSYSNCNFCGSTNEFVKYVMSNGVIVIRQQCLNCGHLGTTNYKRIDFDLSKLNFVDLEKRENYKEKRINQSELKKQNDRY